MHLVCVDTNSGLELTVYLPWTSKSARSPIECGAIGGGLDTLAALATHPASVARQTGAGVGTYVSRDVHVLFSCCAMAICAFQKGPFFASDHYISLQLTNNVDFANR